ncbi:WxL protein host-binding domain-containing protein [Latilactobacillus sakei]
MKKGIKFIVFILVITVIFIVDSAEVSAKSNRIRAPKSQVEPITVQVLPVLPSDNIGGSHLGYYVLPANKRKKRYEKLKLFNPTNQALKVRFRVVDATTNDNGSVDYTGQNKVDPTLLKEPGSELIKTPVAITLKPKQLKEVALEINQLASTFRGQKATAVNVLASGINNQQSSIQNQYNYAIGVILQGKSLSKKALKKLNLSGIKVRLIGNKKPAISIRLTNPDATYLKETKLTLRLVNQRYSFFNYQMTQKDLKIAPNSKFYEDVLLGGKRLVPGVYKLTMTTNNERYHWTTSQYVKITKNQARFINMNNDQYLKKKKQLIEITISVLMLSILMALFYRFRERKKDYLRE